VNKADMIEQIAQAAEVSKSAAERAVDALIGAVKSSLKKGEMVTLVGFGTFYVSKREARAGRNPRWQGPQGRDKLAPLFATTTLGVVGCLAQLVERRSYTANVGGSIPSAPTRTTLRSGSSVG
jgi:DNA-binding protein HU-beta